MPIDPIARFQRWFAQARRTGMPLPESMALATADATGRPSARMVLLKDFDERGFVFYTNYESRKGEELLAHPKAAMCFHWQPLERQIRTFIESLDSEGLSRVIEYKTMNGQPGTSAYWQMIVHVVNHGSYHRGQVATMLRQLGATPAQSTDMIAFFREQSVRAQ